ncbi:DUF397 domain-containing protein [Streptomyces xiamenensis]|uniref:DUF397 domain-containing protein n=1 Tax=Streptomyces xiamenensis TaxID=408015 RepID=UPI0036A3FA55
MRAAGPDLSAAVWRASSYSNASGGQCLEVADGIPDVIPVRDSKCPEWSLTVSSPAWATFVAAVKRGAPS